jgi:hypothetical protein
MTNEEINELIKEQSEEIEKWSTSEKELSRQEKHHINLLLLKKETLEKIKTAREKGRNHQEFSLTITYGLLTSVGEKYPFLVPFIKSKSSLT